MSLNINNQIPGQKLGAEPIDNLAQTNLDKTKQKDYIPDPCPPQISTPKDLASLAPPKTDVNITKIGDWVSMPSPASIIMSLLVTGAAEDRRANREDMQLQGEVLINTMKDEAQEIRKNAVIQLICGIVGGTMQIAGGLASGLIAGGVGPLGKGDSMLVASKAQAFTTASGGTSGIINSVGQYLDSMSKAAQKDLQIAQEKLRINRDELKSFNDSLQELITKIISSMDAIQGNANQTRTKILG